MLVYKINTFVLDMGRFRAQFLDKVVKVRDKCLTAYIKELLSRDLPPVSSGASRATLIPIGRLVNYVVNVVPKRNRTDANHGIAAGIAKTRIYQIVGRTADEVSETFIWDNSLYQYIRYEPTWQTVEKGLSALKREANKLGYEEQGKNVFVATAAGFPAISYFIKRVQRTLK